MCPRCKSSDLSRSRSWQLADLFMALWHMQPYRCLECRKRFYLPSGLHEKVKEERAWRHAIRRRERRRTKDSSTARSAKIAS